MIRRKTEITTEEKRNPGWSYSPQEIVQMLDKGPLPEIYNTNFYTVLGHLWTYEQVRTTKAAL